MRPVNKWAIGHFIPNSNNRVNQTYDPYGSANPVLQQNLGNYCSYCEAFSTDLEVEHIVSQHQDSRLSTRWDNFLVSCGRCNGRDNKTNKHVDFNLLYFPHLNNTFLAFQYLQGGVVAVNTVALTNTQQAKALATLRLLGLDKYPGNPHYNRGFPLNDKRWEHRLNTWTIANQKLSAFLAGGIAEFAAQRGFFSIRYTVFSAHTSVKQALIQAFAGTDARCFDPNNNFSPIPRNPSNTNDSL